MSEPLSSKQSDVDLHLIVLKYDIVATGLRLEERGMSEQELTPEQKLYDSWQVAVCSECKTAACWQGVFYCEDYREAGVEVLTIGELKKLGPLESEDYWRRDEGIKRLLGTAKPLVERRT